MKNGIVFLVLFITFTVITGALHAASTDRFMGGSFDGYDRTSILQYAGNNRFKGGQVDGYDSAVIINSPFPVPPVMLFKFF